jgi:hypothetical protein
MEEFKLKYYSIYFVVALIALIVATQSDIKNNIISNKIYNKLLIIVSILFILFYGFRAINIGTDTGNYFYQFINYDSLDYGNGIIMYYIYKTLHLLHLPYQSFLLLMSCLFVGVLALSIYKNGKIFGSNTLLIFFGLISLFYFQSLGINVMRQGVSLSFLLLAITNYQLFKDKKWRWVLPIMLSVLFHFTSIIPIFIYVLIQHFKKVKLKIFYLIYIAALFLSAINISILNFKEYLGFLMVDERRVTSYLTDVDIYEEYTIGFKPQFVAFNTIFLLFFIYIKSNIKQSVYFDGLLKYYVLLSAIFFMTFQMPYSDRWGLMSWVVIPILSAPVFSKTFPRKIYTITCLAFILIFIFFENYS